MDFAVHREVFDLFPELRLAVAVAPGIDNSTSPTDVTSEWSETWTSAAQEAEPYGNAQSHPRVRPWRERFRAMGVSGRDFPSSIEALLRRAMKGGEPLRISPLVDFYNTVSLRHTVPAGAFDLADVHRRLELRLARPGDTFLALDAESPKPVDAGEVAYAVDQTILTRHFVWRQAKEGSIRGSTRDAFLVSEILGEVDGGVAEAVVADFDAGIRSHFGVAPRTFLVDERDPFIAW